MNTLKKQMIEINQLCNESDEIYHNIAQMCIRDSKLVELTKNGNKKFSFFLWDSGKSCPFDFLCFTYCFFTELLPRFCKHNALSVTGIRNYLQCDPLLF